MGIRTRASHACLSASVCVVSIATLIVVLRFNELFIRVAIDLCIKTLRFSSTPGEVGVPAMAASVRLLSVDFEVFGKVQGEPSGRMGVHWHAIV